MTDREKPPLPTLDSFPVRAFDTIRFGDTDMLGHVNNAVISTYLETGRTQLLRAGDHAMAPDGTFFSLARIVLDFRAEVMWPGQVEVGTRVLKVGRSSVTLGQALFQDGKCVATAETVMVLVDRQTRRSSPFPPDLAVRLGGLS
ncbi:acyl-CoA thioesterase [Xanthobacter pseudotagetidis]|uniref:acyl-CoA thioesterase n=1 Tax=Xanthobacter pseudotagetidis TaxID=3119911 RepID=UPI003726619A